MIDTLIYVANQIKKKSVWIDLPDFRSTRYFQHYVIFAHFYNLDI